MIKQKGSLVLKKEGWIPTSVETAQKLNQHIQLATGNQIRGGHESLFALKPWNHLMVRNGGGIGNLLPEPVGGTASSALSSEIGSHFTRQVQISGPDDAEIEGTVLDPDAATTAAKQGAANTDEPLNLRETLAELNEGHKLLAHRIGNLKVRTPFRQALAAEKAGKELAADQRSNVEFIHAMEDALKRARDAEKALRANKRVLASGLNSHDCDSI